MASATLLLPARAQLAGELPEPAGKALARADRDQGEAGERAQLRRHFRLVPDHWPVAALTRQLDAGDAAQARWLRADPAFLAPDMTGARLLAHGPALGLEQADVDALLPALKPLFGDAGFLLDAPTPARWYLRLLSDTPLPEFAAPEQVLGDDLFGHLPHGDAGRRWRALFTEAQVLLHQHPWNAQRIAQGKPAVNALWFWGPGVLPQTVSTSYRQVRSRDELLQALARQAGVAEAIEQGVDALVDLRHLKSPAMFTEQVLAPLLAELRRGELARVVLDFQDGARFTLTAAQRWRLLRRALKRLDA
ncbi:phosphoglycerate mutase [Pseudoxanthomonas sp. X-1]|uniref:phosphoglycerate mutase n=1 Tax=Pseudoxanthomonas sp. X-1 TaxID=2571115 RepID=UPI00110B2D5D|nr:phosphoglycerate mutase [Pseudoxanthomonas sp. X-1]TMN25839.1 phosphoglycerate mutase [Pseudoxanthomonas sp. X-1]UAY72898.1 phosphoglycerate mutase [Pseudoxanthomonas sp. X-1]